MRGSVHIFEVGFGQPFSVSARYQLDTWTLALQKTRDGVILWEFWSSVVRGDFKSAFTSAFTFASFLCRRATIIARKLSMATILLCF